MENWFGRSETVCNNLEHGLDWRLPLKKEDRHFQGQLNMQLTAWTKVFWRKVLWLDKTNMFSCLATMTLGTEEHCTNC